jgi:hypothetical protein
MERFSRNMVPTPGSLHQGDLYFITHLATRLLGAALMLALKQAGWQAQLLPEGELVCTRGDDRFEPFRMVQWLSLGRIRPDVWAKRCAEAGIADMDLGAVSWHAATARA